MLYTHTLFDFDGVILDSMATWDDAVVSVIREAGSTCESGVMRATSGLPVQERIAVCLDRSSVPKDLFGELSNEVHSRATHRLLSEPQLVAGVDECLRALHDAGIPVGVVSTSHRDLILATLERFSLMPLVMGVVGYEDVTHRKPHPEPYEKGLSLIGGEIVTTVVFEDSLNGIASGVAASMDVVGVTTRDPDNVLRDAGAMMTIADFRDSSVLELFGL